MNKLLFPLIAILRIASTDASAQNSIPNGNFESWTVSTFEDPQFYPSTSNQQAFYRCQAPFNIVKTGDAYHGLYALEMTTYTSPGDTCFAFCLHTPNANGDPSTWDGGIPYNQKPTGIRGYYQYNVATGDSGGIIAIFKLAGTQIGTYFFQIGGMHPSYTLFDFTFNPPLSQTPDSLIFGAVSSNVFSNVALPGSVLKLDSISFTGVSSQPAQMNGDFELWQSQTIYGLQSWYMNNDNGKGVFRSSDAKAGIYAVELKTYLGDDNGVPRARGGSINNGIWDKGCNCYKGGYAFSNKIDTLVFSYKYSPALPNDSALVNLSFRSNGNNIWNTGKNLGASTGYQTVELPFNIPSIPDSVTIQIESSLWQDSLIGFVGADLKIDEIHFKTQPLFTGIHEIKKEEMVKIYPNPVNTYATIEINATTNIAGLKFRVYDIFGRTVKNFVVDKLKFILEKNDLSSGLYFYELKNEKEILKTGKILLE